MSWNRLRTWMLYKPSPDHSLKNATFTHCGQPRWIACTWGWDIGTADSQTLCTVVSVFVNLHVYTFNLSWSTILKQMVVVTNWDETMWLASQLLFTSLSANWLSEVNVYFCACNLYICMSKWVFRMENGYRFWFSQQFDQSQSITNIDHLLFDMCIALFIRV